MKMIKLGGLWAVKHVAAAIGISSSDFIKELDKQMSPHTFKITENAIMDDTLAKQVAMKFKCILER